MALDEDALKSAGMEHVHAEQEPDRELGADACEVIRTTSLAETRHLTALCAPRLTRHLGAAAQHSFSAMTLWSRKLHRCPTQGSFVRLKIGPGSRRFVKLLVADAAVNPVGSPRLSERRLQHFPVGVLGQFGHEFDAPRLLVRRDLSAHVLDQLCLVGN